MQLSDNEESFFTGKQTELSKSGGALSKFAINNNIEGKQAIQKMAQNKSTPQLWGLENARKDSVENNTSAPYLNNANKGKMASNHLNSKSSQEEGEEDLYLKGNVNNSNNLKSQNMSPPPLNRNINNLHNELTHSPSQTFGSAFNAGLNYNQRQTGPEKLYSPKMMNQRSNNATKAALNDETPLYNSANTTGAVSKKITNGVNEMDSDAGSEHSQLSNASKLSSPSVLSAQSELTKGANTNMNNKASSGASKAISGLTMSDGNRVTTVATNSNNNTTTTTTTTTNAANSGGSVPFFIGDGLDNSDPTSLFANQPGII
jgi:hypothetical protein